MLGKSRAYIRSRKPKAGRDGTAISNVHLNRRDPARRNRPSADANPACESACPVPRSIFVQLDRFVASGADLRPAYKQARVQGLLLLVEPQQARAQSDKRLPDTAVQDCAGCLLQFANLRFLLIEPVTKGFRADSLLPEGIFQRLHHPVKRLYFWVVLQGQKSIL